MFGQQSRRLLKKSCEFGVWGKQSGCFGPAVPVMKTADSRYRWNVSASDRALFHYSIGRRALVQTSVSSVLVIIAKLIAPKPSQLMLIQRNAVIEQFVARAAHPSFGDIVLPRTAKAGPHRLEITRRQKGQYLVIADRIGPAWGALACACTPQVAAEEL
jgi:hypothetical protein